MSKLHVTTTRYDIETDDFFYIASRYQNKWTVHRRKIDAAPIPPCTSIKVEKGWEPLLTNKEAPEVFSSISDILYMVQMDEAGKYDE